MKNITQHKGERGNSRRRLIRPRSISTSSRMRAAEFKYVARYELATGKREVVEKAPGMFCSVSFSRSGKYRVVVTNEDARTRSRCTKLATGKPVALPKLPEGDITRSEISESEKLMAFYHNGSRSPEQPLRLRFRDEEGDEADREPESGDRSRRPRRVAGRSVTSRSTAWRFPAILYQPHGASAKNKVPALVLVHGGPGGQARMPYNALAQYLANHGYTMLDVNNRGSSGYGKTFFTADDRKHGASRSGIASKRRSISAR